MTLTPDEMKQYKQLQAKAEAVEKPLTDDDLRRMEQCVASAAALAREWLMQRLPHGAANNQGNRTNPRSG